MGRGAVDDQGGIECSGNIKVTGVVNLERNHILGGVRTLIGAGAGNQGAGNVGHGQVGLGRCADNNNTIDKVGRHCLSGTIGQERGAGSQGNGIDAVVGGCLGRESQGNPRSPCRSLPDSGCRRWWKSKR